MKNFLLFSILLSSSAFAATSSTQQTQLNQQLRVQQQQPSNSDSVNISQQARANLKIKQLPSQQRQQEVAQTRQLRDQPATGARPSRPQAPAQRPVKP